MKKIGFVGAFDKVNLVMYTAKVLQNMNYKVLVIDGTMLQKTRYVVPTISHAKMYITEFEKMDFAVGFQSMEQVLQYLQINTMSEDNLPYDYVLIDVDNRVALRTFEITNAEKIYFVTGFDIYSLKRGIDIFTNIEQPINLTKVLYSNNVTKEDEDYLNYLALEKKIIWNEEMEFYCPLSEMDNRAIEENQRVDKIRIKRLSGNYQQSIIYIVQNILNEASTGMIKKSIIE